MSIYDVSVVAADRLIKRNGQPRNRRSAKMPMS